MSGSRISSWFLKLSLCGVVHAVGMVLGGVLVRTMGLESMPLPAGADIFAQFALSVLGGMIIAVGLAAMAVSLSAHQWQRWAILAAFAFIANGVAVALETSIFLTLGGDVALATATLPASALCALAVVWCFPVRRDDRDAHIRQNLFKTWTTTELLFRVAAALIAFPLIYLLFGAAIVPVVRPIYSQIEFLVIPSGKTIFLMQILRSTLFFLISIPVALKWCGTRRALAISLGLAHFACVGLNGLIQTSFFPVAMRLAHGAEVFADSFAYALVFAWLFGPVTPGTEAKRRGESQTSITILRVACVLTALACVVAVGTWPFAYYLSVRVLVSCVAGFGVVVSVRRGGSRWAWVLGGLIVVFNPVFPFPLSRELWQIADLTAAATLIVWQFVIARRQPG